MVLSVEDILFLISKQFSIYVSFSILIGGVICNVLNITIFTQLTIFRYNQSTFYFISESIADCIQILIIFTFRITFYAFGYDPTQTSILWCKIRPIIAQICAIVSTATVCFSAIDQYLSTSYYARFRQMSSLKLAHYLTISIVALALLHAIPFALFYGIDPNMGCGSRNPIFTKYVSFVYFCILIGLLPITVSSIFAALAYFNVRRITRHQIPIIRRRLDRQLTAMVLVRVCLLIFTTLPFIAFQIYQLNVPSNPNDLRRIAINQLIAIVSYSIYFFNYSSTFYVFLISSTRFRRQVKYFLCKKIWRQCCLKRDRRNNLVHGNQVVPLSHISTVEMD